MDRIGLKQERTIDDQLLMMIQDEMQLSMQIEQLKRDIEFALDTDNKALFLSATKRLNYLHAIYKR